MSCVLCVVLPDWCGGELCAFYTYFELLKIITGKRKRSAARGKFLSGFWDGPFSIPRCFLCLKGMFVGEQDLLLATQLKCICSWWPAGTFPASTKKNCLLSASMTVCFAPSSFKLLFFSLNLQKYNRGNYCPFLCLSAIPSSKKKKQPWCFQSSLTNGKKKKLSNGCFRRSSVYFYYPRSVCVCVIIILTRHLKDFFFCVNYTG